MRGAHRLGCFFMLAAIVAGLALLMGVVTMGRAGAVATIAIGVVLGVMFLMFLGLVTAAFGMRRMARPVEALVDAAQRVAAGDYAVRVAANPWGPPALRTLSGAFNSMAERLEADAELRRRLLADTSHELPPPSRRCKASSRRCSTACTRRTRHICAARWRRRTSSPS
ncbi:MAG: HAMP domain-containing protein [Dehalococcoidia bacterium]|nr:HAMP domain-containing protein [Dehalococcoidia bacterium]